MFIEGIWVLAAPQPAGLLIDGILLISLGIWNIVVTLINLSYSSGGAIGGFAVLGIWQINWGVQSIVRHNRMQYSSREKPSEAAIGQLQTVLEKIKSSNERITPDIVEFQVKLGFRTLPMKGLLMKNSILFVLGKKDYIPASKQEIRLMSKDKKGTGDSISATLRIGKLKYNGRISKESQERLLQWSGNPAG